MARFTVEEPPQIQHDVPIPRFTVEEPPEVFNPPPPPPSRYTVDEPLPHPITPDPLQTSTASYESPDPGAQLPPSRFGLEERAASEQNLYKYQDFAKATPPLRYTVGAWRGGLGTVQGMAGMVSNLSRQAELEGAERVATSVARYAEKTRQYLMPPDPSFVDSVSEGMGSAATFFVPGFGLAKGAQALATVSTSLAYWTGATASAVLEETVNSGIAYQDALKKGMTPEQAERAASQVFWTNLPVDLILNKLGIFGEYGSKHRQMLVSSLLEGSQEGWQEIIGNMAIYDPYLNGVLESAAVGAIVGGAVGAAAPTSDIIEAEVLPPDGGAPSAFDPDRFQEVPILPPDAGGGPSSGLPPVTSAPEIRTEAPPPVPIEPPPLPEAVDETAVAPPAPLGEGWESDRGAMPGEPQHIYKENGAIIEVEVEDGAKLLYEATTEDGSLGIYPDLNEAKDAVERYVDSQEQPPAPEPVKEPEAKPEPKPKDEYIGPEELEGGHAYTVEEPIETPSQPPEPAQIEAIPPIVEQEAVEPEKPPVLEEKKAKEPWEMTRKEMLDQYADKSQFASAAYMNDIREWHKNKIKDAIAKGIEIPHEVMAEYPELYPKPEPRSVSMASKLKKRAKSKAQNPVKDLAGMVAKRSTLPILGAVHVDASGTATATDLDITYKRKLESPPAAGIYEVIGNELVLTKMERQDYPVIDPETKPVGDVDAGRFIEIMDAAALHVSEDEKRYVLMGVSLAIRGGVARIAATDGKRMFWDTVEIPGAKDGDYIIPNPKKFIKALKSFSGDTFTISAGDSNIKVEGENGSVTAKLIDGTFPNYSQVIPESATQLTIPKDRIAAAIKELMPYAKKEGGTQTVAIKRTKEGLVLKAGIEEASREVTIPYTERRIAYKMESGAVVMPVRITEKIYNAGDKEIYPGFEAGYNAEFLSDAVNTVRGDTVYLGLPEKVGDSPASFTGIDYTDPKNRAAKPFKEDKPQLKKLKKSGGKRGAFTAPSSKPPDAVITPETELEIETETKTEATPAPTPPPTNVVYPGAPADFDPHTEMPELVKLAEELMGNRPVVWKLRSSLGKFIGSAFDAKIKLNPAIFKNATESAKILAHEIGHLIDWLPDYTLSRGNILGRLKTLRNFLKTTISALPEESESMTQKMRETVRRSIRSEVIKEKGGTMKQYFSDKDFRKTVNDETSKRYKEKIEEVAASKGFVTKQEITRELEAATLYWHPFEPVRGDTYTNYRFSSAELYAEALSMLLVHPTKLQEIAPKFYKLFWENLDAKPEVKEALIALDDLLGGSEETKLNRRQFDIRTMFRKGEDLFKEKREERKKKEGNWWFRFKQEYIDKNAAIIEKNKEARKTGKLNPEDDPVYFLESYNYIGGKIHNILLRIQEEVIAETQRFGISQEDLGEYLFLRRVVTERSDIANPLGQNKVTAQKQLDALMAKFTVFQKAEIEKAVSNFRVIMKEMEAEALKSGLYTDEIYQKIATNDDYATFQVLDYLQDYVTSRIVKMEGTLKDIANPLTSTILKMISLRRAIERNNSRMAGVKMLQNFHPSDISEADYKFDGKARVPVEKEGEGLIIVYEGGKQKGYYVDPYIADSYNVQPTEQVGATLGILNILNRSWFRPVYINLNLGFQTFNAIRDFLGGWKKNPNLSLIGSVKGYFKAAPIAASRVWGNNPHKVIREMYEGGMLGVTYNDVLGGKEGEESHIEYLLGRFGVTKDEGGGNVVTRFLDRIAEIGTFVETLPKVVGYMSRVKGDTPIQEVAHEVRIYDGSPDFLRKGKGYHWTNSVFLFSNAIKEGFRSDTSAAFRDPKTRTGYWWKTVSVNLSPKLLMFLAAAGGLGDELKKMFAGISEYDKSNYTVIPYGWTDNGQVAYLRIPHDEAGRFLSAIFWKGLNGADGGIKKAVADTMSFTAGQLPGFAPPLEIAWVFGQYVAGNNPYDLYRGRQILTRDEDLAGGFYAAKKMGKWFLSKAGLSGFMSWTYQEKKDDPLIVKIVRYTPILGRFLKFSDYGFKEKEKEEKTEGNREKAIRRLENKEAGIPNQRPPSPSSYRSRFKAAARRAALAPALLLFFAAQLAADCSFSYHISADVLRRAATDKNGALMVAFMLNESVDALWREKEDAGGDAFFGRRFTVSDLQNPDRTAYNDYAFNTNIDDLWGAKAEDIGNGSVGRRHAVTDILNPEKAVDNAYAITENIADLCTFKRSR